MFGSLRTWNLLSTYQGAKASGICGYSDASFVDCGHTQVIGGLRPVHILFRKNQVVQVPSAAQYHPMYIYIFLSMCGGRRLLRWPLGGFLAFVLHHPLNAHKPLRSVSLGLSKQVIYKGAFSAGMGCQALV